MKEPILTGKALEEFNRWMRKSYPDEIGEAACGFENASVFLYAIFEDMPISLQLPIIQEWLDSVGIYTNAIKYNGLFAPIADKQLDGYHIYRNMALKAAIIKANELYNNRI